MSARRISGWGVVAIAAAVGAAASIGLLAIDVGAAAGAGVPADTVAVTSDRGLAPGFAGFSPGHTEVWRLDATPGSRAQLELRVEPSGRLATATGALGVTVASCRDSWTASSTCAVRRVLQPKASLGSAAVRDGIDLGRLDAGATVHLQLEFAMVDTAATRTDDRLMGLSGSASVRVVATGVAAAGGGGSGSGGGSGGAGSGSGDAGSGGGAGTGQGGTAGTPAGGSGSAYDETDPGTRGSDIRERALAWTGPTDWGAAVLGGALIVLGLVTVLARRRGARE